MNSCCRSELLQKVHANTRQLQDDMIYPRRPTKGQRATSDQIHAAVRDTNVDLITTMLEALEQEHEFLCALVLHHPPADLLPVCADSLLTIHMIVRAQTCVLLL